MFECLLAIDNTVMSLADAAYALEELAAGRTPLKAEPRSAFMPWTSCFLKAIASRRCAALRPP